MSKWCDKISPARLTLCKAMFVMDPALEKPIYHEDSMLNGPPSLFFFFFALFPNTKYDSSLPLLLNAQCPVIFPCWVLSLLSQPSWAANSHMDLFASSFFVPVTMGPSALPSPLSAAQCPFQFKLKSDSLSLAFASPPPVASLVIYYLTQSPYYICTGTISEYGCCEKK